MFIYKDCPSFVLICDFVRAKERVSPLFCFTKKYGRSQNDMFVYVISKDGQPLMPTTRFGKVRKLLKRLNARKSILCINQRI